MTDTTESSRSTDDRIEAPPPPAGGYPSPAEQPDIDPKASSGPPSNPALRLGGLLAGLAIIGFLNVWVLVMILGLVVMIFLHELGHYIMAKRSGMKVTEFFLCFGPKLWSFKRGETEYGVKLLPLGAYVKIIGMSNLEEVAPEDEARAYRQKSFWQRIGVAVAGSTMQFILAAVLIFLTLVWVGAPGGTLDPRARDGSWVVGSVVADSGAADAGLRTGDRIVSIDGQSPESFDAMRTIVVERKGETVPLTFERDGKDVATTVDLRTFSDGGRSGCCLGIGPTVENKKLSPVVGAVQTPLDFWRVIDLQAGGLAHFFSGSGLSSFADQVSSGGKTDVPSTAGTSGSDAPSSSSSSSSTTSDDSARLTSIIGIVRVGSDLGSIDPASLLVLFAMVNISLGVINLFPLLPLDGGHVAIAVYERIQEWRLKRRRYFADVSRLLPVTYAFVLVLGLLAVSTMYLDIVAPVSVK